MSVSSPVDVGRLIRELEQLDDAVLQEGLRHKDKTPSMPKTSQLMDRLLQENHLDLLEKADRQRLREFLTGVKDKAPVLHISFSADPPASFIEKIMAWLRREIDPLVLMSVGLQPNIGAGCIVRGRNKQFDFSLRQDFLKKRDLLLQSIAPEQGPVEAATAPPEARA